MAVIHLTPTLQHCIQTVSKWEYERLMHELLDRADEDRELIAQLELLYDFLQTANFSNLRAQCDRFFTEGREVSCIIARQTDGTGATCKISEQAENHGNPAG